MNQIESGYETLKHDYKELKDKGYWFAAKRFGWGWTPITWQGWVSLLVYVLLIARDVVGSVEYSETLSQSTLDTILYFPPSFVLYTILFVFITYGKGERPHWNWSIKFEGRDK